MSRVSSRSATSRSEVGEGPASGANVSLSANGVLTAQAPGGGSRLGWFDLAGRRVGTFQDVRVGNFFRVSFDGSQVFAPVLDPKIGTYDLFTFDAARGGSSRLTHGRAWEAVPVPSPDGKFLYYAADRLGPPDIFRKVLDSPEEDTVILADGALQYPSDVSRDGSLLLFQSTADPATRWDLWVLPLRPGAKPFPFVRTPFTESFARFSPDGKSVAYVSNESGRNQVYVRPFPGPGPARQISVDGGTEPRWSADGRMIYFRSDASLMRAQAPFDTDPEELFENRDVLSFELAPDGQRVLALLTSDFDAAAPTRVVTNWRSLLKRSEE